MNEPMQAPKTKEKTAPRRSWTVGSKLGNIGGEKLSQVGAKAHGIFIGPWRTLCFLVPKFHLGTHLSAQFYCRPWLWGNQREVKLRGSQGTFPNEIWEREKSGPKRTAPVDSRTNRRPPILRGRGLQRAAHDFQRRLAAGPEVECLRPLVQQHAEAVAPLRAG